MNNRNVNNNVEYYNVKKLKKFTPLEYCTHRKNYINFLS